MIPAAGASSRMGAWKLLLPWGHSTICGTVVDTVISAGLMPVLVSGYRSAELALAFIDRPAVRIVENSGWQSGMLGSIQKGIRAALEYHPDCDGLFVTLSDMPGVPANAFLLVGQESTRLLAAGKPRVVFACKDGRLGHPVWIPDDFLAGVLELPPDARLRDYLVTLPWSSVEVDDDGIHADIDTPQEYAAIRKGS